jgi:hypothetical protein
MSIVQMPYKENDPSMKTVELYMIHGTVQYNGEIRAWERDPLVEKILSVRCSFASL